MTHYFETPGGADQRRDITVRFWDSDWTFTTSGGVFSHDRLDLGTAVLLRESVPPAGPVTVLDLGCGYGPIAIGLAVANPQAIVYAVDVNERALDLCRVNAQRYGVADRVRVLHPDQVPADLVFDEIWSNPPIRIGKSELHELLLHWLARLRAAGQARLVVGRNLGADSLQRWLVDQGLACDRVASAKGFRVFSVRRPAGATGAGAGEKVR